MTKEAPPAYPRTVRVGGKNLSLRLMSAEDRAAILSFARSLPEHDLLFLPRDITEEATVDQWLGECAAGLGTTIVAEAGGEIAGYATIRRGELRWSAHVAELQVLIAPAMRGKGLGRLLTHEAFSLALTQGIEKMVAQMTLDQKGAVATFEGLGFRPEALLRDHVKDRQGKKHDLLVLSHEVATFAGRAGGYGVWEAFGR
jgi:L-amino acid N-acyltransferase YncA